MKTQQEQIYEAQGVLSPGAEMSRGVVEMYVDTVVQADWWPETSVHVRFMNVLPDWTEGITHTEDNGVTIVFPDDRPVHERTVIHELAHALADTRGSVGHDPIFARAYLELMYRLRGTDAWLQLQHAFDALGVVY